MCRARLLITVGVSQQAGLTRLLQLESTVTILSGAPINVALLYFTHYCAVLSPGISRCCRCGCCRSATVKRFDPKTRWDAFEIFIIMIIIIEIYLGIQCRPPRSKRLRATVASFSKQLNTVTTTNYYNRRKKRKKKKKKKGQQKQCNWYDVKINSWLRYFHSLAKSPSHTSHSIFAPSNINTQFVLQSVCVCFRIILHVNCFGRTVLYMFIQYHI